MTLWQRDVPSDVTQHWCFVTTIDHTLNTFYRRMLPKLTERGVRVTGISSPGPEHAVLQSEGMEIEAIEIARVPKVRDDVRSLIRLTRAFRRKPFTLIVVSTPKGALLGALGALLAGKRNRLVYIIRGRAYENMSGLRRLLYTSFDRLTCYVCSDVIAISDGLSDSLVTEGICSPQKIHRFGHGSSKGVDLSRFRIDDEVTKMAGQLRSRLGVAEGDLVVGYLGWLRREKGIDELVTAFVRLSKSHKDVHLLLVGKFDNDRDSVTSWTHATIERNPRIHAEPWLDNPAPALAAMDIFAFPTYREGFGNVAIEAAAMGIPVVAADVPGVREAVSFGSTAIPVMPGDSSSLEAALVKLAADGALRRELGSAGMRRVRARFSEDYVLSELIDLLMDIQGRVGRQCRASRRPRPVVSPSSVRTGFERRRRSERR